MYCFSLWMIVSWPQFKSDGIMIISKRVNLTVLYDVVTISKDRQIQCMPSYMVEPDTCCFKPKASNRSKNWLASAPLLLSTWILKSPRIMSFAERFDVCSMKSPKSVINEDFWFFFCTDGGTLYKTINQKEKDSASKMTNMNSNEENSIEASNLAWKLSGNRK